MVKKKTETKAEEAQAKHSIPLVREDATGSPPVQETAPETPPAPPLPTLQELETRFLGSIRQAAEALREIRTRDLYKPEYATFEEYMELRWGHSKTWCTLLTNWLWRVELLEANGMEPYRFSKEHSAVIAPLDNYPEEFVRAYKLAEEAQKVHTKKTFTVLLREAVAAQQAYMRLRTEYGTVPGGEGYTWEEHEALMGIKNRNGRKSNVVEKAEVLRKTEGLPLKDALVKVCKEEGALPLDLHLLRLARQEKVPLAELIAPLVKVAQRIERATARRLALTQIDKDRDNLLKESQEEEDEEEGESQEGQQGTPEGQQGTEGESKPTLRVVSQEGQQGTPESQEEGERESYGETLLLEFEGYGVFEPEATGDSIAALISEKKLTWEVSLVDEDGKRHTLTGVNVKLLRVEGEKVGE